MPFTAYKNTSEMVTEIYDGRDRGRVVRTRITQSGIIFSTDKQSYARLTEYALSNDRARAAELSVTHERGIISLEDKVEVSRSLLMQLLNASPNKQQLIGGK
jgi:hypothetical protein